MTDAQTKAIDTLRRAGYEPFPRPTHLGYDLWVKDNATECIKQVVISHEGGWFHIDTKGPLADLSTMLFPTSEVTPPRDRVPVLERFVENIRERAANMPLVTIGYERNCKPARAYAFEEIADELSALLREHGDGANDEI